jgi:hypothetical protein
LEKALKEALETDDENSDENTEAGSACALVGSSTGHLTEPGAWNPQGTLAAHRLMDSLEEPSSEPYPAQSSDTITLGSQKPNASTSPDTMVDDDDVEYIIVQSRPPTSVKICL